MGQRLERLREMLNSPKGKNVITFLVFLAISAVLWIVMSLNEESQRDLRCTLSITNVPDSVVQITPLPESLNVSIRSRGTSLLRYLFSKDVELSIDYRSYANKNIVKLNDIALRAYLRNRIGANAQIMSVSPDSLKIYFSAHKGIKLPVKVDAHVVPGPQYAIIGKVRSLCDSVMLYAVDPSELKIKSVSTAPIVLNDVRRSQTLCVPLLTPPNVRAIPDSVDVHIDVEPLVSKTRNVQIRPVNVPEGYMLITVPNSVEVYYMVPMSIYKSADSNPAFVVQADYRSISEGSSKIAVSLKSAPKDFQNVFVDVDSVEYILEKIEP